MNTISIPKVLILAVFLLCSLRAVAAPSVDPAKLEDKIAITPGQKLTIQFQAQGDALKNLKIVDRPDEKQPNLAVEFGQHEGVPGLILSMKHGFSRAMSCRCLMRLKGQKEYVETRMLPAKALMAHYESWTDPIEEIVLFEFKLTGK